MDMNGVNQYHSLIQTCMDQSIENIKNDQNWMVVKAVDPVTNACPSFSASSCDSSSRLLRVLQHDENLRVVGEWEGAWDTTSWRGQSSQPLVGGFIIFSPIQEVQVMVMNNANCLMFEKCSWVETLKPPLHPEDSRNSACCSQQPLPRCRTLRHVFDFEKRIQHQPDWTDFDSVWIPFG